jgi:hypothetical protein
MSVIDVYSLSVLPMLTVVETAAFSALWPDYWTEEELGGFCFWLARNPNAGDVVPESGGCRKVRWALRGAGKSGGVRVIYFTKLSDGQIWLVTMYAKNERSTIPGREIRKSTLKEKSHGKAQRKGTHRPRR